MTPSKVSAEDLRAAIARSVVYVYVVAGRCLINPIRLSRLLRGHEPITAEVVVRILLVVENDVAAHGR